MRVGILGTGATAVQAIPHLAQGVGHLYVFQRTPSSVDVTAEAEAEWVETVIRLAVNRIDTAAQCTPGYYNNEGNPSAKSRQNGFFLGGPTEFKDILEAWRADGSMKGLVFR